MKPNASFSDDEPIRITHLFDLFWKRRVWVVTICFLSLLAGVAVMLFYPKEYRSTTTMLLLGDKGDMASEMKLLRSSSLSGLLGGAGGSLNVDDEIAAILSTEVLGRSIRELSLNVDCRARIGLKRQELYDRSPVLVRFDSLFLASLEKPRTIEVDFRSDGAVRLTLHPSFFSCITTDYKPLPALFSTDWGHVSLSRNEAPHDSVEKLELTINPFAKSYEEYLDLITVKTVEPMSDVVSIRFSAENKQRSADLLNAMADNYNKYSVSARKSESSAVELFINERLDEINSDLAVLEYQIESYKRDNRLTDIATDVKIQLASFEAYKVRETEFMVQQRLLNYVVGFLNDPKNDSSVIPIILTGQDAQSPIAADIAHYNKLVSEQTRLKQYSGDMNPALLTINEQLRQARSSLTGAISTLKESVELSLLELHKTNRGYDDWISRLPTNEREFIEIKRMQTVKEKLLVFMLQKLEESAVDRNPYRLAGRVISAPYHSYRHTFPRGSIVLPVALLVGLMLSLIVVLLLEKR